MQLWRRPTHSYSRSGRGANIQSILTLPIASFGPLLHGTDCTDGTPCYVARVTELPGCESHGITPDEALDNLEDAKRLYIESMIEDGIEPTLCQEPVPTP